MKEVGSLTSLVRADCFTIILYSKFIVDCKAYLESLNLSNSYRKEFLGQAEPP
jgi:hypothetical protein